ncbi:MAG TPA: hypothetical protein VFE51_20545 [Verrucomicrobiae bacterium]|nr:hypothetical protein [Verrucomicrobiae bacterium]
MKEIHSNPNRRSVFGRRLCLLILSALLPEVAPAADSIWLNTGTITTAPQIDATNFVNSGAITIASTLPFETSDTLNFTNSGTMFSIPGWFFDDSAPNLGVRRAADNFVNLNGGDIEAIDGGGFVVIGSGGAGGGGASSSFPSYLFVDATNVVNKGTLAVGGNGWLKIRGTNVNLARSALEVTPIQGNGSFTINQTNFLSDVGISDVYWGQTNITFNSSRVWDGTIATAPPHGVQQGIGGGFFLRSFSISPSVVSGYSNTTTFTAITLTNVDGSTTNVLVPTNIVKQAVFVAISDPSIMSAAVTYTPSSSPTNPFQSVAVQLSLSSTNVITQENEPVFLYFYDTLASETNRGLFVNSASTALPPFVSARPANYNLSRLDTRGIFFRGTPGNIFPDANFLYDPTTFSNAVVSGEYAGYAAFVDNLASEPPPLTPGTVTNFPGRAQVYADTLDLRNTRIRGEGEVIVQANHLISSAGAAIDCENLSYTLGSTNGQLHVAGLSKDSVIRMKGTLYAWSGLWSNQMNLIITNNYIVTNTVDTNGVITGTNAISSPITNAISVGLYALILDGSGLAARLPVITWELVTHSTNIVVDDNLRVVETLFLDGQSFTLNGNLSLTSTTLQNIFGQGVTTSLLDWFGTNAPGLLYFTNNGSLSVPDQAHFGDDRPIPYSDFVNKGTLTIGSLDVLSTYIENDGTINANVGPLDLVGQIGEFQGGQTLSSGDLNFAFGDLKFLGHTISTVGAINFDVTGALSDAGPTSANTFTTANGFNLLVKPNTGDLLGTTVQDSPPNFVEVDHVWAAEDRGATAAGFANNEALGQLVLSAHNNNALQAPLFFFTGTNGQRALYVDLLDLTSLGSNYTDILEIDPSFTIYYAAAKLGFTPPPNAAGLPQEPEEFLNGQFGGHLVWDSSFAGPNSSVDVVINGVTVSVNRALRFSKIIDSNNNGLPNFYDPFPFDANPLVLSASRSAQPAPAGVAVSWNAAPHKSYQVEYMSDVLHSGWQPLTTYTHNSASSSTVTIWDTNAPAGAHRFYRVKTTP